MKNLGKERNLTKLMTQNKYSTDVLMRRKITLGLIQGIQEVDWFQGMKLIEQFKHIERKKYVDTFVSPNTNTNTLLSWNFHSIRFKLKTKKSINYLSEYIKIKLLFFIPNE